MKCKYKKFLKAAYINYEEDYCSNATLRDSRPPLSEILAPATFELTLSAGEGYYWTTFYTSMANYLAPEGVTVYKEHLDGKTITPSAVDDRIINKRQGVILRSSTSSVTLTKTYSISSDNYSDNSLIGTDYDITNPGHAYVLGNKSPRGIGFYKLSSTGKIKANKAYLIVPITYLTQWKIVGNSEVHSVGNLTSWKVSGNSIVDNNAILSCGDYSDVDGKYHVKISNGVTIFDIALTEPLRKVNDVADTIEFPSETEGKALVIRPFGSILIGNATLAYGNTNNTNFKRILLSDITAKSTPVSGVANILCSVFEARSANSTYSRNKGISVDGRGLILIYDPDYNTASDFNNFKAAYADTEVIYELATPTTELVDAPQISVSPTDTYTSANEVSYSAFEHTENKEIWSCGEYNPIDGKWHILVKPQGGSIADIALTEPLRKVNDVADIIEFPSGTEGKALVTRNIVRVNLGELSYNWRRVGSNPNYCLENNDDFNISPPSNNDKTVGIVCPIYTSKSYRTLYTGADTGIGLTKQGYIRLRDSNYDYADGKDAFVAHLQGIESLFILATPTTELVDAPQIEEAENYTCVISQGGKAVSWSGFETE